MHVVLALEGTLSVQSDDGMERGVAGVLTGPDVEHGIDARGCEVLLVFLEPESAAGMALMRALDRPIRPITPGERAQIGASGADPMAIMSGTGTSWTSSLVRVLCGESSPFSGGSASPDPPASTRIHPRVKRALGHLRSLSDQTDASLEKLAARVGLSPSRFMHVFTESIGIPLRAYVAWLKLQRASAAIAAGTPLSHAALGAGFADAAHMTRSFRHMLGVTPSELRPPKPSRSAKPERNRLSRRTAGR
jgi:AraC-like DNA-binding protein